MRRGELTNLGKVLILFFLLVLLECIRDPCPAARCDCTAQLKTNAVTDEGVVGGFGEAL